MEKAKLGLFGLAVMGQNLALNLARHGVDTAVYNIEPETYVRAFIEGAGRHEHIRGCYSLSEFVGALERPRVIWLMIRAGQPVDDVIASLMPLMDMGDIIIDGGNSHFADTARRMALLESAGMRYVGMGVSGGGEGALNGPSLMPGGSESAWPVVAPILQAISARANGEPCCRWIGRGGAGHYVKMVHNGIEYGDMQIIGEAYAFMRDALGMSPDDMSAVFERWNQGALSSYLIGVTAQILRRRDADGAFLIDRILDTAGQKGTGRWTGTAALEESVPLTLILEAVCARFLSAEKDERVRASAILSGAEMKPVSDRQSALDDLEQALYAARIVSYAQGFLLMRAASEHYGWALDYGAVAAVWRGGCIIRSAFLGDIRAAFEEDGALSNLALSPFFADRLNAAQAGWRRACVMAIERGVAIPALSSALAWFDGLRTARGAANLLQAQRDYFGAHTYERTDAPRGEFFHTDWTELGTASSGTYNA